MPLKLGVLLSGGGTTLQHFMDSIDHGDLNAQIVCVVSSREDAYGLVRAESHGIPTYTVSKKKYHDKPEEFCRKIWEHIREHQVDLVLLAGFMSLLTIPQDYRNRIMNTHPALIPAFCGKGMYGHHVYEAVLEYGAKITGVTIHFADDAYDHGPIIIQEAVPVLNSDTPDTLASRVQAVEKEAYVNAVALFAEGRLIVEGRRVRITE